MYKKTIFQRTFSYFLVFILILTGSLLELNTEQAIAASKPARPAITLKTGSDGNSVTILIAKTSKAKGFQIMIKAPGSKKYVKLDTLDKDGSTERRYTVSDLDDGIYSFKVRAYTKSGKKTVWGKYSKAVKIKIKAVWNYNISESEIKRAQKAGLVPDSWGNDLDKAVTFSEYTEMIGKAVDLWVPEKKKEWDKSSKRASVSDKKMRVEDGCLMLAYLLEMGADTNKYFENWGDSAWNSIPDDEHSRYFSEFSWDYPLFPDWETEVFPLYMSSYASIIIQFPGLMSWYSGNCVLPYDLKNDTLHLQDTFRRDYAICALLRMLEFERVELDKDWAQYINIKKAGTYDTSVITDALLQKETSLPTVTQEKLPNTWNGSGMMAVKQFKEEYVHFREADIIFLKENGFNFARLNMSFVTLRYPDYPDDHYLVNKNELLELDRLIAWGIENDIHIQIAMNGYMKVNEDALKEDDSFQCMPQDDKAWELTISYWKMLAQRYKGIDSKYLTFDLSNESEPWGDDNFEYAKKGLQRMVEIIREADPDRVLVYSQGNMPNPDWTEVIASCGVAVGCHPYVPDIFCSVSGPYVESNPYAELSWPMPFFPTNGDIENGKTPIVITGEIGGKKLELHLEGYPEPQYAQGTKIQVNADNKKLKTFTVSGNDPEKLYSVDIPEGAKEISIQILKDTGYAKIDTIMIEKGNFKCLIMASDTNGGKNETPVMPLIVDKNGNYSNASGTYCGEEYIYNLAVKPYRDIAQKYGVGFMINEFGMFGCDVHWDIKAVCGFHDTVLKMCEKYKIPWCNCETYNILPKHIVVRYGGISQWSGATEKKITVELSDGTTESFIVCKELLDTFRKHTKK